MKDSNGNYVDISEVDIGLKEDMLAIRMNVDNFDEAYEKGIIDRVLTTNLTYQTPELLTKPYYISCDMSKYIALIIDTLNHDASISGLLDPVKRIQKCLTKYRNGEVI